MEENVALDSSKQKQFIKSIKGIKKILKGKDKAKLKGVDTNNVKIGKIKKPNRKKRGLVYLSHIPHGFYEHQMTEYFKQFGVVTNARVIRSKRTGMSKGHAFVEFKDPNVAQIVAETMNNYLMGKRLIKAAIIPPEKQRKFAKRKHWNAQNNPGNDLRQKMKKAHNSIKDEKEELQIARKLVSNLNKTKKRLHEIGINYDFFTPVDIPEPLLNLVEVKKEEDVKTKDVIKKEKLNSNIKQEENAQSNNKKSKKKKANNIDIKAQDAKKADSSVEKKSKQSKEFEQSDAKTTLSKISSKDNVTNIKITKAEKNVVKKPMKKEESTKVEKKNKESNTQKQKEKKLKDAGVKPPENFIQLKKESDDESDSSIDFDSDEYDKIMEQSDSDVDSEEATDESDEDLDEDITSEEDASVEIEISPPKKVINPSKKQTQAVKNKKQGKKLVTKKPSAQLINIKPQKDAKPSRKPKFEKKVNKKTINKVIKKKK